MKTLDSKLMRDAAQETFIDLEAMIYSTIHRFIDTHGGNFEDMLGIAHEAFIHAFLTYDRRKGPFSARLRFKIRTSLQDQEKKQWLRSKRLTIKGSEMQLEMYSKSSQGYSTFWLIDFMDQLSSDARTIVTLTLRAPINIRLGIAERGRSTPKSIRAAIREVLMDCGWASSRVTKAFNEIGRNLNGD